MAPMLQCGFASELCLGIYELASLHFNLQSLEKVFLKNKLTKHHFKHKSQFPKSAYGLVKNFWEQTSTSDELKLSELQLEMFFFNFKQFQELLNAAIDMKQFWWWYH